MALFEIVPQITALAGPKAELVQNAMLALQTSNRATQASAKNIPPEKLKEHVVKVLLNEACDKIMTNVVTPLRTHLDEVKEEFELMEGEAPAIGLIERQGWMERFEEHIEQSFAKDVHDLVGVGRMTEAMEQIEDFEEMTKTLAQGMGDNRNFVDPENGMRMLGFSTNDLDSLVKFTQDIPSAVAEKAEPKPMDFPMFRVKLVGMVRDWITADKDLLDLDLHLDNMSDSDMVIASGAAYALGLNSAPLAEAIVHAMRNETLTSGPWKDKVLEEAMQPAQPAEPQDAEVLVPVEEPTQEQIAAATAAGEKTAEVEAAKNRKTRTEAVDPSEHQGDLLDEILKNTAFTEQSLSEVLGVSRAQLNNYRKGKTPWTPTDEQNLALRSALSKVGELMTQISEKLEVLAL